MHGTDVPCGTGIQPVCFRGVRNHADNSNRPIRPRSGLPTRADLRCGGKLPGAVEAVDARRARTHRNHTGESPRLFAGMRGHGEHGSV
ncbi:MAG: hypothetical protein AMXMBFR83_02810 [Phycisphaerae bacterium]